MKTWITFCCIFFLPFPFLTAKAEQTLIYSHKISNGFFVSNQWPVLNDLREHGNKINTLAPMSYFLKADGSIVGGVNQRLLDLAQSQNVRVLPTLSDRRLSNLQLKWLLSSSQRKQRLLKQMLHICQQNHFAGLQLDWPRLQNINLHQYAVFFKQAANRLHQHGFKISAIIYPRGVLNADKRNVYEGIANQADFITVMAYRHMRKQALPEELAPIGWVKSLLQDLLKTVPAGKISLGVPVFSREWKTNRGAATVGQQKLAYQQVITLLRRQRGRLVWNGKDACSHAVVGNAQKRDYLSVEDADSFAAKLALVKRYHLRGISMNCLTREDPAVWGELPTKNQ